MSDHKKPPVVFRTGFNVLFMLMEVIIYIIIIAFFPWGFGLILLNGYEFVMQLPIFLQTWIIGFFLLGGFVMSGVGLIGITSAMRGTLKKSIRRIRIGRK